MLNKDDTIQSPSVIFLNAVEDLVLRHISLEKTYKRYSESGLLKQGTNYTDFLSACAHVFIARLAQTELPSYYSIENMFEKLTDTANYDYSQILKQKLEDTVNGISSN